MGFHAGAAAVRITPQSTVELAGYGPYMDRRSQSVHDELSARCVVLGLEGTALALVSCDVIAVPQDLAEWVESRVRTELPGAHVVVAATHTHSGPATVRMIGWGEPDPDYLAYLRQQLVDVVLRAASRMTPATIRYATGSLEGIVYNRERKDGPVDTMVQTLWIEGAEGEPLAVVFGFGCHAVVLRDDNQLISADFPGAACRDLMAALGAHCQALFLQAPCGDVDPTLPTQSFEVVERYGGALAQAVLSLRSEASVLEPVLVVRRDSVDLPVDVPDQIYRERLRRGDPEVLAAEERARVRHLDLNYGADRPATRSEIGERWRRFFREWAEAVAASGEAVHAPIICGRIGPVKLLALPWEMYVELGLELRQEEPAAWPVTCAQGCCGYVPDSRAYGRAEYPAVLAPLIGGRFPYKRDVGPLVVRRLLTVLEGV